jgi:hypothetical protein
MQKENIISLFLDIGGVLLTNGWDHTMRQGAARKFDLGYEEMNVDCNYGLRSTIYFDCVQKGKG